MNHNFAATQLDPAAGGRGLRPVLIALLAAAFAASAMGSMGCDMGLQKQLDDAKEQRWAKAKGELEGIETQRNAGLAAALKAADGKLEKGEAGADGKHPLLEWRRTTTPNMAVPADYQFLFPKTPAAAEGEEGDKSDGKVSTGEILERLAQHYRGTPTEPAAVAGAAFARESARYWTGDTNLSRYVKFLEGYLKDAEARKAEAEKAGEPFVQRPFVAEAAFDLVFLHGARIFQLSKMRADIAITTAFPYWQLAFNFSSKNRESFSNYVTRLCRAGSVAKNCKGVPHEYRPQAINQPYLEWLKGNAETFNGGHKEVSFNDVAGRLIKALDGQLGALPDFSEDPVLPATYSSRAASTALLLKMSPKSGVVISTGIQGGDTVVSEKFSDSVPGALAGKVKELVTTLKDTPGNMVDYERIVFEAPGTLPGKQVIKALTGFPREIVRQVDLIGRRRADESLRRTGLLLRLPAADEPPTTSYQFAGDSAKTSCDYLGIAGKSVVGRKNPGHYLVIDGGQVRSAKLSRDPETRELSVGATETVGPITDAAALNKWAEEHQGIVRLFTTSSQSYDDLLKLMSGILYKCEDVTMTLDEREEQKITVTCGKSSPRDITLVLGLCK